jgi:hypothetical protein
MTCWASNVIGEAGMKTKTCMNLLGFVLVILGFTAMVFSKEEEVINSSKVGDCSLTVEVREQVLRLRAHHPEGRNCLVDKDSMLSVLSEAFSETRLSKIEGAFTSLFIGRLIDYPWLSQYLALTAQKDKKWNAKKGKPLVLNVNQYVSGVLSQKEVVAQIETIVAKSGYQVSGVSVEKVLVGGLREVPQYAGDRAVGLFPYDAQVWFRLEWKGKIALTPGQSPAESIAVEIPDGFMAVTDAQRTLVAEVKRLSRGMSQAEVKERLGRPVEESADLLFYNLIEGAEGGYYLTAELMFDKHGLSAAKLGFGHVSMKQRIRE